MSDRSIVLVYLYMCVERSNTILVYALYLMYQLTKLIIL